MGTENLENYKKKENLKKHIKRNKVVKLFLPAEKFINLNIIRPACDSVYCRKREKHYRALENGTVKRSKNEEMLEKLRNSHIGETAFIIGNGPSLHAADLDLLYEYNAYSFACNRISLIFDETKWRPDCYAAIDRKLLFSESFAEDMITGQNCEYYFFWSRFYECLPEKLKKDNVISIEQKPTNPYKVEKEFSDEPQKYLISGYTVTNLSIQMAVYMGFTTLCVLGIDCKYANEMDRRGNIKHNEGVKTYFKVSSDKTEKNTAFVAGMLQAYENAKDYAARHNINIYNCSKDSCLEIFEHRDLETVLKEMNRK